MSLRRVFHTARLLGDTSSLEGGFSSVSTRAVRRIGGRAVGRFQGGLSVANLFIYAQFLRWLRQAVENKARRPVYVVNAMRYAEGYNSGFVTIAKGRRLPPPGYQFFSKGLEDAVRGISSSSRSSPEKISFSRSGLYIGGRFTADVRAIYKGNIVGRVARRGAGREASRFFWGTLRDPKRNPLEAVARRAVRNIRRNIRDAGLVDTEALVMATQWGNSKSEAMAKSRSAAIRKLTSSSGEWASDSLGIIGSANLIHRKVD